MSSQPNLATTAINLAELSSDMLTYASNDARALANAAQQLVGYVLTDDALGPAMSVAASAARLSAKLESMRCDVGVQLAELIALESADHPRH